MNNPIARARLAHAALLLACSILFTFALASDRAQGYASAARWLALLAEIDLVKWAVGVENRQGVVLGGPLMGSSVLREEAERVGLAVERHARVTERVNLLVKPAAAEAEAAPLDTLLTQVFANVEKPALFRPDQQALHAAIRTLCQQQAAMPGGPHILSAAVLDFDSSREPARRGLLRLTWRASATAEVPEQAPTRVVEAPLSGSYQQEFYDFDRFVAQMVPALVEASGDTPWPRSVHARLASLSPEWDQIKGLTLAGAQRYVQAQYDATRGDVRLFGATLHRQPLLIVGNAVLVLTSYALLLAVARLDATTVRGFLPHASRDGWRATALTRASMALLPVSTAAMLWWRFGEASVHVVTLGCAVATAAAVLLALTAYQRVAQLRRPPRTTRQRRRIARAKRNLTSFRRGAWRRGRVLGVVMLILGLVAGPIGAAGVALFLISLSIGGQTPIGWPLLAVLASPPLVLMGWLQAAGRKKLVLFLRRFGNEALNDAVRELVQTVLRRRARLVTLDDSAFVPLGPRWQGLAASLLPSGVLLVLIALGFAGFAKVVQSEIEDETPFGPALTLILFGILFVGLLAVLIALGLVAAAVRAHYVGRLSVRDETSLARALKKLRRLRSLARAPTIAAPMATVVSVSDALWQRTVASIAPMCDVTLVDISHPREAIRWELETLRTAGARTVLLAQRDALAQWWELSGDDLEGRLAKELRHLTRDLPLVAYDSPAQLAETELLPILSAAVDRA